MAPDATVIHSWPLDRTAADAAHVPPTHDMDMEVKNDLIGISPVIGDQSVPWFVEAERSGRLPNGAPKSGDQLGWC